MIDPDGDAWLDDDNCPDVPNPLQANGDAVPRPNGPLIPGDDISVHGDGAGDACDADDDHDGLADVDEAAYPVAGCPGASSPLDRSRLDTDGDHLADAWECAQGLDPADAASRHSGAGSGDADGDRVPDLWEQRGYAMSGAAADSDGDACADLIEVASVDANDAVTDADRIVVARRALAIWPPDPAQDYVLDIDRNGAVGDTDRIWVARAALLADWLPKSC